MRESVYMSIFGCVSVSVSMCLCVCITRPQTSDIPFAMTQGTIKGMSLPCLPPWWTTSTEVLAQLEALMTGGRPGRDPGVPPQCHALPVQVQTGSMPEQNRRGKGRQRFADVFCDCEHLEKELTDEENQKRQTFNGKSLVFSLDHLKLRPALET